MHEHPNVAVVRRAYEVLARGNGALDDVATPGVCDDLRAVLDADARDSPFETRSIVPLAIAAAGDLVVAIDHLCARRGGRALDVEGVAVFTVVDRRIVNVRRLPRGR